jgi:hypothetical protein
LSLFQDYLFLKELKLKKERLICPNTFINLNKMRKPRVVLYSIVALACVALSFLVNWIFIIPAVIIIFLNQRELMRK